MQPTELVKADTSILHTMCRTSLLQVTSLPLVEAYFTLNALFGLSNGERDDSKTQWSYELAYDKYVLEVYDYKMRGHFSIGVWEKRPGEKGVRRYGDDEVKSKAIADEFLDMLTQQSKRVRQAIAEAAKTPAGYVIDNVFAQYYYSATDLVSQADQLKEKGESLYQGAFILFLASVEAFVNLVYELFLRPELRSEIIIGELRSSRLDLKIRLAPLYCTCFQVNIIEPDHIAFVNFLEMLRLRNRFVHANITDPMRHPVIQKDGHIFMSDERRDSRSQPRTLSEVTRDDVARVKSVVDELVTMLIGAMRPELIESAEEAFWNYPDFGLSSEDRVLGVHVAPSNKVAH